MINKQSIWFLTLFSIILVLSIYYIAMPNNTLATIKENDTTSTTLEVNDTDEFLALKVENEEETETTMNSLQEILLSDKSTKEEKNNAYEKIKSINESKTNMEKIEKIIKDNFELKSFVKINDSYVTITISKKDLDIKTANNIIRKVQENFDKKMYITIKYQ